MKANKLLEKIGSKIPDPVIIFIILYAVLLLVTAVFGGNSFTIDNTEYTIKNMFAAENIRWIFDNALLDNWLGYAGGIVGTILIVMFGIGTAEESGFLSSLIRRAGANVSDKLLPFALVFLGILSNIATDAGYVILVPLAGLLYAGIGKNPIIGMAAAFAGVSAGFSANLIPATVVDVVIGTNAEAFSESQGVPFVSYTGRPLNAATMNYYFMAASTVLLVVLGGLVTVKITRPRLEKMSWQLPEEISKENFSVGKKEKRALWWGGAGILAGLVIASLLFFGPLKSYVGENGKTVTPFSDNIILIITLIFFLGGLFYGIAAGTFSSASDVIGAMSKQLGSMGYVLVLTFFSYNFLALLGYTNIGAYITYAGANLLQTIGADSPLFLIAGFILVTAFIDLFVGGLTAKWMLLGPIFIPMLYRVNPLMTPDIVAAAYRVGDSCINIISPIMTYAGVILMYMRRYKPDFTIGSLVSVMAPYSAVFLVAWTVFLVSFVFTGLPLGF